MTQRSLMGQHLIWNHTHSEGHEEKHYKFKDGKLEWIIWYYNLRELKEIFAPDGYLLNTEKFIITINKYVTTIMLVGEVKEPKGSIFWIKEINTDELDGAMEMQILKGMSSRLIKEDIQCAISTIIYFNKGETIGYK